MSILSMQFVLFLVIVIAAYYVTPGKHQWKTLLVMSYVFYMFTGVRALLFILITSFSTYFAGLKIGRINDEFETAVAKYKGPNPKMTREEKKKLKEEEDKRKRVIVIAVLVLNFGILVVLKYVNPICGLLNGICSALHISYEMKHISLIVPLGISYYTFQAMGYIIDLYRRKYKPETSLPRFMLFISFFPQLIQGPISRYDEFATQLFEARRFRFSRIKYGVELMAWGLFKKMVISDRIAIMTAAITSDVERYAGLYLVVGTMLSMLQLYTDFSGGIDITRGVAQTLGIEMPENFVRPFFSPNQSEYWRRWHITLNNWWRDYIFYPLTLSKPFAKFGKLARKVVGDNFGKKLPILLSVIIIRLINSIWHGASGGSLMTGFYYGMLLALSFYFEPHFLKINEKLKINTDCVSWKVFQCVRTFVLISAPRLVSGSASMEEGLQIIRCTFKTFNPWILVDGSLYQLGVSSAQFSVVVFSLLFLFVISYVQEKGYVIREELEKQNMIFRWIIYIVFIYTIILFGAYGAGYNAASFTYAQI